MAYLHELNPNDYQELLAADQPAVPDPEAGGILPVNQNDRTLLIGLGGTGAKVVDQIKQQIAERCAPGSDGYVQFLAIDTDPTELENANFLTPGEKVCLTRPGMGAMQHGDPAHWPPAWHKIVEPNEIHNLPPFGIPGAGGSRLVGKLKLYYQAPNAPGNDVVICQKLQEIAIHKFAPAPAGCYRVYVIGSLYGGTGSGCFLEMPALIRSAFPAHMTVEIHALLLTANARDPRVPPHQNAQFQANCYAALKELDYYQGLGSRAGFREVFPSNDPAQPHRTLNEFQGLFQNVHLFDDVLERSIASIHTFLLAELVDRNPVTGPVFVPATPGSDGFLLHYTTAGVARVEVPTEIVQAYLYGNALKNTGLLEEPPLESAANGNAHCGALLQPLKDFVGSCLHPRDFVYADVCGAVPTHREFHDGIMLSHQGRITAWIDRHTSAEQEHRLRRQVRELYTQFRHQVRNYAAEHGPLAFWNLFRGRFAVTGGELPQGLGDRLYELCNGQQIRLPDTAMLRGELTDGYDQICHRPPLLAVLHQAERAEWVCRLEQLVNIRIAEKHLDMLLGQDGILAQEFLTPAKMLSEQLYAFGQVLRAQGNAWLHHGNALESYADFQKCGFGLTKVNSGGLNMAAHGAIVTQARQNVHQIDPRRLRDLLVNDFFENPDAWLYVDNSLTAPNGNGHLRLRDSRRPVAARHAFARIMGNCFQPLPRLSVAKLFQAVANAGISEQQYAHQLVTALAAALPQCSPDFVYRLTYPRELTGWGYVHIENALQAAANNILWHNVQFFTSPDADSITLQQISCPMEIPRIVNAYNWEQEYLAHLNQPGNGLHGISPDGSRTPWKSYPGICPSGNPNSHTFIVRRQMDEIIHKARERGILYAEQGHGYMIRFAHLAQDGLDWHYEPMEPPRSAFAVLQEAAAQNGRDATHLSRSVYLANSLPMPTEEQAWEQARLVLYAHRPLLCAIQDTLELTEPWFQAAAAYMAEYARQQRPKQFHHLLMTGVLREADEGWILTTPDGEIRVPCREWELDPDLNTALEWELHLYVLYEKLMRKLPPEEWDELAAFARKYTSGPAPADTVSAMLKEELEIFRHMPPAAIQNPDLWTKIRSFYENIRGGAV